MNNLTLSILLMLTTAALLSTQATGQIIQQAPQFIPVPSLFRYVKPDDTAGLAKGVVTAVAAEVFTSPSGEGEKVGEIATGQEVYLTSPFCYNGWCRLESKDKKGRYLRKDDLMVNLLAVGETVQPAKVEAPDPPQYVRPSERRESPWRYIGSTVSPTKEIYYRDPFERYHSVEAWTKWVIKQPVKLPKSKYTAAMRTAAYYLQYASADCDSRRISLTNTIFYTKDGRQIYVPLTAFMGSFYEPILPDSVGEMIWNTLCD